MWRGAMIENHKGRSVFRVLRQGLFKEEYLNWDWMNEEPNKSSLGQGKSQAKLLEFGVFVLYLALYRNSFRLAEFLHWSSQVPFSLSSVPTRFGNAFLRWLQAWSCDLLWDVSKHVARRGLKKHLCISTFIHGSLPSLWERARASMLEAERDVEQSWAGSVQPRSRHVRMSSQDHQNHLDNLHQTTDTRVSPPEPGSSQQNHPDHL